MKKEVIEKIKKLTGKKYVKIVPSGNYAIYSVLYAIKDKVNVLFIPDQGGWMTYDQYAKRLKINFKKLKTDFGVLEDLRQIKTGALLITSFAGYYAEQPMNKIKQECVKKNCILIEDASGSLGDKILGKVGDIIVGSFGKWKVVEAGEGGFIATDNRRIFNKVNELKQFEVGEELYSKINEALKKNKLKKLLSLAKKVKKDLKNYPIFHRDKRGVNVIAEYNEDIIKYCKKNEYEFVVCPKRIRIRTYAISIELKRK